MPKDLKFDNYQYAFHSAGLAFLLSDIFLKNYQRFHPLILQVPGEWVLYLPKDVITNTLREGKGLAGSPDRFGSWQKEFIANLDSVPEFMKQSLKFQPSDRHWQEWVDQAASLWKYYPQTEWFYTDYLYQSEDYLASRLIIENLKQRGREAMNTMFFGNSAFKHVVRILSKQLRASQECVLASGVDEVTTALKQNSLKPDRCTPRFKGYGLIEKNGQVIELTAHDALQIYRRLNPFDLKTVSLKGISASPGSVQAPATIIPALYHNMTELNRLITEMPKGNILVATTTSPDLTIAIHKASAIVTDQGGLGSHAAIMARELHIPCVVGTRNATKIIKDSDFVEVDANQGIVRIVERS